MANMKQTNEKIESSLKKAFQNVAPDLMNSILADCENEKGRIITMTNEKKFSKFTKWAVTTAACLAMILGCFAGYSVYHSKNAVVTTVTLDVNPSLEIKANEDERVMEVVALNKDAEIVIGNMEFEGSSLELTVNALVGSMLRNGYINEITNSVLLSVDSKDEATGKAIKEKLAGEISYMINTEAIKGSVISQTVSGEDKQLSELAAKYGVTLGKANLIQAIVSKTSDKTFAELVPFSITELNLMLESVNDGVGSNSDTDPDIDGIPSQKGYIGKENAYVTVLQYYNVPREEVIDTPVIEFTVQNGIICYRVEFTRISGYYTYKYDVYINAATGWTAGGGYKKLINLPFPAVLPKDVMISPLISQAAQKKTLKT